MNQMLEVRRARWSVGIGWWQGKPLFGLIRLYHDGPHVVFHLGPFWVERY